MKRKTITNFIIICMFIFAFLSIDGFLFKFNIVNSTVSYISPVGVVFSRIGTNVSGFVGNISKVGNLTKENEELQDRLDKALVEVSRLSVAQKENNELKADLNFKKTHDFDLVGANVVFFDPNNIRETITIDIGTVDGLQNGDAVLARGYLVGKVKNAVKHTSKVLLITDPESAIPAVIDGNGTTGIAKGKIGNGLILDQVPQSEKVKSGDIVTTSGLGGQLPKGLIIGRVETVKQISGSIFQEIILRPMVDLNLLDKVMVIKG